MESAICTASIIDEQAAREQRAQSGSWSFSLKAPLGNHWPEALRDAAHVLLALSGQERSSAAVPVLGHAGLAADLTINRETGEMRICGWLPSSTE